MRCRQLLWVLPALFTAASCTQHRDAPLPQHGVQQRGQYSVAPHPDCEDGDFVPSDLFGTGDVWMHDCAEAAEEDLCSAMLYFQKSISFQTAASLTATDRIHSIRSSMHFLNRVAEKISDAFNIPVNEARVAAYERYMANMLAETTELAHNVASTGAEMSVGFSDAGRSSSGSYTDLADSVWGHYDMDQYWYQPYANLREGRRGSALAILQGWPWRSVSEVIGNYGDPATLPACSTNMGDHSHVRAVDLLSKHGVPVMTYRVFPPKVWIAWNGWEFGSEYLTDKVNEHRIGIGLPALTYEEILEEHETTDEALLGASVQLYREIGIYLKPIVTHDYGSNVTGLAGMTDNIEDYQQLLVRSWTGAFYLFESAVHPVNTSSASAGLIPVLSNLLDLSGCLLDEGVPFVRICSGLSTDEQITDYDAREIVNKTRSGIFNVVGSRSVLYHQLVFPTNPASDRVVVEYEGFDDTTDVVVYSVPNSRTEIVPEFYKVLSCVQLDSYDDLDCEAYLNAAEVCNGTPMCLVSLPPVGQRKMIIVAKGSKVIDMYAERRPFDVSGSATIYTRHFIDQSTVSEYGKVITKRNSRDCSKPYSNSLGLPVDMAIPLENELTSDSDNYSDAYAYYLERAKEAGNEAGNAVERASQDLINQQSAELRVENQRQDALDRIEQICGVGQTACSALRMDLKLSALGLLPDVQGPGGDCPPFPDISGLVPAQLDTTFNEVVVYVRCRAGKFVGEVGEIDIAGLPVIIEQAALAGELTSLSYSEYGGEYKTALLELSSSLVDLRSAVASTNTVLDGLPTLVEMEKNNILAMQLETVALLLDALASALKPGLGALTGSTAASAAASGVRALANVMKTIAASLQFMLTIQDQVSKIEQNMLSVEKAVLAMKTAIERLNGLELEQQQSLDRADRLGQAELAQYVGTGATSPLKAFRQHTLVSHMKARRAVRRAKKMAFIARKAVEQRLAVDLTMEKEMPVIGEPPAKWVDDLFTMYQSGDIWEEDSAAYTYVQRLEDYVYNYPFQYPFADGSDTAVISLRDDLSHLDQNCITVENVKNLVSYSEEIERWSFTPADGLVTPDIEQSPLGPEMTADFVTVDCRPICAMLSSEEYPVGDTPASTYAGSIYVAMLESGDTMELRLRAEYRCYSDWSTVLGTPLVGEGVLVAYQEGQTWQRVGFYIDGLPDLTSIICANDDPVLTLQIEVASVDNDNSGETEAYLWGAQIEAVPSGVVPKYGPNVVIDGDMEQDGVSAWTPSAAARLEKIMNGHLGTRSLRVKGDEKKGAYAAQSGILVPGETYRFTGWANSYDGPYPAIGNPSEYDLLWIGEPKPYWQLFDILFVAASDSFYLLVWDKLGSVDFDDIVIQQVPQGTAFTEYEPAPLYGTHADCITVTVQDPWSTDPEDTIELTYYDPTLRTQRLLDSFSAKCVDDQFAEPGQTPGECADKGGVDYMERQFSITLNGIESGEIVQQGQIGGGNYNYRINDLAINLVGSNVKDCSLDPGAGTTCYANQFIPYDLIQDGAVKIRNHADVELPFKLSVGRIHQAKGLAAERLMTNPLSSTDSALIQQYRKNEFRGRPIQGVYTLRIHAVPSLRWTSIEDVQLVLGYRYWSAFSSP